MPREPYTRANACPPHSRQRLFVDSLHADEADSTHATAPEIAACAEQRARFSLGPFTARCAAVAIAAAAGIAAFAGFPQTALAEDIDTDPSPDALQLEIERTAAAYEEARARAEETQAAIDENTARIAELEQALPAQQSRSNDAAREQYKLLQESYSVVDFILAADSLVDFLKEVEYVTYVTDANVAEMTRLKDMKQELDSTQEELDRAKAEADEQMAAAQQALEAAKEARREAQRRAQEEARRQAEAAAAAQRAAAAQAASTAGAGNAAASGSAAEGGASNGAGTAGGTDSSSGQDGAGASADGSLAAEAQGAEATPQPEAAPAAEPAPAPAPEPAPEIVDDGADWMSEEDTFVNEWAGRIDAYLAGSPLAGYGRAFAQAAWSYGVDPRWSPAISFTESSKGASCFRSHNAWGWGSVEWDSWEEAIDSHVRGLARGYGYTISRSAAAKYCPPNADHWYTTTLAQMNMI